MNSLAIAAVSCVALAFYLALGAWETVWPVFGSANQLIAGLTLVVVTVVLWRRRRPTLYTLLPAIFMLVTTMGALVYQGREFLSQGKPVLGAISIALLVLALLMVSDSLYRVLRQRSHPPTPAPHG